MQSTIRKSGSRTKTGEMVCELATTLEKPRSSANDPIVLEDTIQQTRSVHVLIIWDRWEILSPTERSQVILAAYAKAGRLHGCNITVAMGLTGMEALRMGYLPYSIVSTRRVGDKTSQSRLSKVMASLGGVVQKVGTATQLRFPTLEQAEDAYRKLSQEVPGPYWAIVHDPSTGE